MPKKSIVEIRIPVSERRFPLDYLTEETECGIQGVTIQALRTHCAVDPVTEAPIQAVTVSGFSETPERSFARRVNDALDSGNSAELIELTLIDARAFARAIKRRADRERQRQHDQQEQRRRELTSDAFLMAVGECQVRAGTDPDFELVRGKPKPVENPAVYVYVPDSLADSQSKKPLLKRESEVGKSTERIKRE